MESKSSKDIATAKTFETILEVKNEKQLKTMKVFCGFCGLVALLSLGTLAGALPFKDVIYKVIAVDTVTGHSQLITSVSEKRISQSEALGEQYSAIYLKKREGYNYPSLQDDYNQVQVMSNNAVKTAYLNFYAGPDAPDVVNRKGETYIGIKVISQLIRKGTDPDMVNDVRFDKQIRNLRTGEERTEHWTARITYRFDPSRKMTSEERETNAMGYVVTSYETAKENR